MPTPVLHLSNTKLRDMDITPKLQALRKNSLADNSHFAVSAIIEVQLPNGNYAYVGGVNVENDEHNRLGNHAEQTAISTAQTLFGGNVKFSKV